jgi:2C-methyl-D-erythritol 2,4-cyclodiphosphate synthase
MTNQILSVNDLGNLVSKAKDILNSAKAVAMPQAWQVLQLATADIIQSIEDNSPTLKGADKKTLAMTMVSNFYDQVFTIINFPFVPKILQPIIQKYVKQILMLLVSATIDALVTTFRNSGIFVDPSTKVDSVVDNTPPVSDK